MTDYCPHTTNPIQLKSLCGRCRLLDSLGIDIYKMPKGEFGCSVQFPKITLPLCNGVISDGFKSREEAEEWAIKEARENQ